MSSPIEMLVDGKLAYWQFRAIFTIEDLSAGSGTLTFTATPGVGNFFILDTLRIGKDDVVDSNPLTVNVLDEDDNSMSVYLEAVANDNARHYIPSQNVTDADTLIDSKVRYINISGDDQLNIGVTDMEVNETFTISLRAYISSTVPTTAIAVTGTNATVATSTTLNKVVA